MADAQPPGSRKPVVFSDFDGTITERDVIMMIMEAFAPPVWRDIVDNILEHRSVSIREGVDQLFELIPASRAEDMACFVRENVRFRDGFPEFLDFCDAHGIPFVVVSGGADFFIEPLLAPYRHRLSVFCNGSDFSGPTIRLTHPHAPLDCPPCNACGCCKLRVMAAYPVSEYFRIAVGDSLTDLAMARTADWAFARSKLLGYAAEEGFAVTPYDTFHDVRRQMEARLASLYEGALP